MSELILIRHGQTQWNLEGRYTGQSDIPLSELGHQQAESLPKLFRVNPPSVLYASDLLRARQTAQPLATQFGLDIKIDARLKEINQGAWEGMLLADIESKFAEEFAAHRSNPTEVCAPGGETIHAVRSRVFAALEDILASNRHEESPVVIVSHGFVIALVRLYFSSVPVEEVWSLVPTNIELIRIDVGASTTFAPL